MGCFPNLVENIIFSNIVLNKEEWGMNLLGREYAWDNLMRIKSFQVAAELLEVALVKGGKDKDT